MRASSRAALVTLSVAALAAAATATPSQQERRGRSLQVPGERVTAPGPARTTHPDRPLSSTMDPLRIDLLAGPVQPGLRTTRAGQPEQIGFARDTVAPYRDRIAASDLAWSNTAEGRAALISVRSPGAAALRLGLVVHDLPPGAELRFLASSGRGPGFGPYGIDTLRDRPRRSANRDRARDGGRAGTSGEQPVFWSPIIDGEQALIEIRLPPDVDAGRVRLALRQVSHLVRSPNKDLRDLSHVGQSGACQVDLACDAKWQAAGDSVAKLAYTRNGGTFLCTGQLLADTDPMHSLDFLLTANHCLDDQAVAETLELYWFFQRAACDDAVPEAVTRTTGGADLLTVRGQFDSTDHSLLLLREPAPVGAARTGWSTREPNKEEPIAGVHHPRGDLKKRSAGLVKLLSPESTQDFDSHIWVRWDSGVTESGSSGSGIWSDGNWPDQFLIGTLTSGGSACSTPTGIDHYGRFDLAYPDFEPWLDPASVPTIASGVEVRDRVEGGDWKVYRVELAAARGAAGAVDAVLRDVTGNPDLYLLTSLAPSLYLFDCASNRPGAESEQCALEGSGGPVFIGVYGQGEVASEFTLVANAATGPSKPPKKPKMKKASREAPGQIRLTWADRSKDEQGFTIERRIGKGAWEKIATLPANSTTLLDTGLEPKIKTCYRGRAFNAAGDSAASNKRCTRS